MTRRMSMILAVLFLLWAPVSAAAESVQSAADIVAISRTADGTRIIFAGEAIGEDLRADKDHRWVNLSSGGTALGVYLPAQDAVIIERYGDYDTRGDQVLVTGIVNIACQMHGGDFDVHAERISVTDQGGTIKHEPDPWKGVAGIGAAAAGMFVWWYHGRLREREAG